jgi:hypothetical protein
MAAALAIQSNFIRIQQVERAFGGLPLVQPGRVLLGEGRLLKSCRKGLCPRQVFLFSDTFVRGRGQKTPGFLC